ncbi:MAG: VWA domain-containing protein [Bacteroidales bacterium]|nr:VWA domain-containing protein [Bacteroidales bacterium]
MLKNISYSSFLILIVALFLGCEKDFSDIQNEVALYERIGGLDSENQPGVLTAGEWNDLDNWDFWQNLMQDNKYYKYQDYWEFHPNKKHSLNLKDTDGNPVPNAIVGLYDNDSNLIWQSRTDNAGNAELWYNIFEENQNPKYYSVSFAENINFGTLNFTLNQTNIEIPSWTDYSPDNLDILFVIDATGSMSDELEYLKTELLDVINRVKNQNQSLNLRLGAIFYRDEGSEYIIRTFSLTENIDDIINSFKNQFAAGGGDYPEAVDKALEIAITQQSWSENAIARLLFLVLDAPPHHNAYVIENLQNYIKSASEKGIKIIPVTASGIDIETEFLMRFFAISTNGTYTFITNDSGIGYEHLEPTVGQYEVEYLNNLIVRLITKYSTVN